MSGRADLGSAPEPSPDSGDDSRDDSGFAAAGAVRSRYGELIALLARWRDADPELSGSTSELESARAFVISEARLLDDRRHDDWLGGWAPDGILWVPLDAETGAGDDQSLYLDDIRRLTERLAWRRQPTAWSQDPAARTVRTVSNVEARGAPTGALLVRSVVTIHESRRDLQHAWVGHQYHELMTSTGGRRLLRSKVLVIPELRRAVPHPGVLL